MLCKCVLKCGAKIILTFWRVAHLFGEDHCLIAHKQAGADTRDTASRPKLPGGRFKISSNWTIDFKLYIYKLSSCLQTFNVETLSCHWRILKGRSVCVSGDIIMLPPNTNKNKIVVPCHEDHDPRRKWLQTTGPENRDTIINFNDVGNSKNLFGYLHFHFWQKLHHICTKCCFSSQYNLAIVLKVSPMQNGC